MTSKMDQMVVVKVLMAQGSNSSERGARWRLAPDYSVSSLGRYITEEGTLVPQVVLSLPREKIPILDPLAEPMVPLQGNHSGIMG